MYQRNIDALLAAWNSGDLAGLNVYVSENCVRKGPMALNSNAENLAELKEVVKKFRTAFPDCQVVLHEIYYQDDRSFGRWTFTGTNTGPGDFPPTGKSICIEGCSLAKYSAGKVVEELVYFDALEFLNQLGLIELPAMA